MTEVVDGTVDTGSVGRPRRDRDEPRSADQDLADRLIAQAQEQGVELLGEGCRLKQMTKAILDRSMPVELTEHLGYEEGDPAGAGSGNSRNGSTRQRLATEAGQLDLEVPRDPNGSFAPQTVRKDQRRLDGVAKLVMGLYARGVTVREVQAQLQETFDLDVSHNLISDITSLSQGHRAHVLPWFCDGVAHDASRGAPVTSETGTSFVVQPARVLTDAAAHQPPSVMGRTD